MIAWCSLGSYFSCKLSEQISPSTEIFLRNSISFADLVNFIIINIMVFCWWFRNPVTMFLSHTGWPWLSKGKIFIFVQSSRSACISCIKKCWKFSHLLLFEFLTFVCSWSSKWSLCFWRHACHSLQELANKWFQSFSICHSVNWYIFV